MKRRKSRVLRLPAAERAYVDPVKLRRYLLSASHPEGRYKAAFFARFGYTQRHWRRLGWQLRILARTGVAEAEPPDSFGRKYRVSGSIPSPSGRNAEIVTVWIILHGEDFPRLVTAFPGGAR